MNTLKSLIVAIFCFTALASATILGDESNYCGSNQVKKDCETSLTGYDLDASKTYNVKLTDGYQKIEVSATLFTGENYKLVFNTKGINQAIQIEVYNKSSKSKSKKMLYSNIDELKDSQLFTFEPEKSGNIYINFFLPPRENEGESGCITMAMGYKSKFAKLTK